MKDSFPEAGPLGTDSTLLERKMRNKGAQALLGMPEAFQQKMHRESEVDAVRCICKEPR